MNCLIFTVQELNSVLALDEAGTDLKSQIKYITIIHCGTPQVVDIRFAAPAAIAYRIRWKTSGSQPLRLSPTE